MISKLTTCLGDSILIVVEECTVIINTSKNLPSISYLFRSGDYTIYSGLVTSMYPDVLCINIIVAGKIVSLLTLKDISYYDYLGQRVLFLTRKKFNSNISSLEGYKDPD